jgi:hypothetical protein
MSDTALVPAPLYGLRTWRVVGESGAELLAAPHQHTDWPPGGAWLDATCERSRDHEPPNEGCGCGLHAWHPSRRSAKRVLASRCEIPGIAELRGATEVHADGLRAQRARPYVLFLARGRNGRLVHRLAQAYRAEVVEVDSADSVIAFCRARGLGLDAATVVAVLGPATAEEYRRSKRDKLRLDALRLAVAVAAVALLAVAGLRFATDPPGDRVLHGRMGEIHTHPR